MDNGSKSSGGPASLTPYAKILQSKQYGQLL